MTSGYESSRGKLPDEQYNKIRKNFGFLIDHITDDTTRVKNSLFEKNAFNMDDMEEVEKAQRNSNRAAAEKILKIILGCGHTGYAKFIDALHDNRYYDAVFKLEPGYQGHRDDKPGITRVTCDELLIGLEDRLNIQIKSVNELLGKRNDDSPRLRTMKGEALTNLDYVQGKKYVETRALGEGLRILKNRQILGVIGAAGDGKTTLSMMIANQFIEVCPEYKALLINDLDDLKEVNFLDDKYLLIIDDIYGKFNKLQARIERWRTHFQTLRINKERGRLVLIYVLRDYIYHSCKDELDKYDLFEDDVEKTTKLCLHNSNFALNDEEKRKFFDFYEISSAKIKSKITDWFGFPSIVSLCSKITNDKLPEDFDKSEKFVRFQLQTFMEENKHIYATLLLVFCLHKVSEKDLKQGSSAKVKSLISTITDGICPEFELIGAKSKLHELSDTFVKCMEEYCLKIFSLRDFIVVPFLHHLSVNRMEMALQYCSFELLMALVRTNRQDDHCLIIRDIYYDNLYKRFLKELHDKNADIFRHPSLIDYKFLSYFLNKNGIADMLQDAKFINLGDIREMQESGNFLHYITLHGDMRCFKEALLRLPQLVEDKTKVGWDIIGLAAVSMHDPIEKINLLKEKKIGDLLALPHLAVYSERFDIVKHISNFTNFDQSKLDAKSRTILHNACDSKHDNRQIIDFLMGLSFDVNVRDESGSTPLHLAVARGKKQTVSILIDKGAEVNAKDNKGRLPIHTVGSTFGGRSDVDASHILNQLIQAGSVLHWADDLDRLHLLDVIANTDIKCFKLLTKTMPLFDTQNKYIQTIIGEATEFLDNSMLKHILDVLMPHTTQVNKSILFKCCDSVDKMEVLHNKGMDFNEVDDANRNILHFSCRNGSIDTVRYLVNEIGLDINQKDKNGYTPVVYSVVSDIDPVKKLELLSSAGCSLQVLYDNNRTLLHISCQLGIIETVQYLVNEKGLDVHQKSNDLWSPALFCCTSNVNPIKKLKFLSSKGVNLRDLDNNDNILLHCSCLNGTIETVKYLVNEEGSDINFEDNEGRRPAIYCCMSNINPIEKLEFLSSKGVSLHSVDNNNRSLLHVSCKRGTVETVEYLVNMIRLDVHHKDNEGRTPAVYCCMSNINPVKKLKFLQSKGVSLHTVGNNNLSLLHFSGLFGIIETVEYLVNEVVLDVHINDSEGMTPAIYCCISNIDPVKKLQLLASKSLHAVDKSNKRLLHVSCRDGATETVEYLINKIGHDANQKDNKGWTPAMICVCSSINPVSKFKFLVSKEVSLHKLDDNNLCLLHPSCQWGIIETVKFLVNEVRLDINRRDNEGRTPVMFCSLSSINPIEKLKFLSSKGVSLHSVDNNNKNLLHVSCRDGTIETVEYLVNMIRLDFHHKDNEGRTPAVHCSVSSIKPIEKLKFLSLKGASLRAVDTYGMSLLHVSCLGGTIETVEYLVNMVGLKVHHEDNEGRTPVTFSSVSHINPIEKLKFLSSKGVSLHSVDNNNENLLYVSCRDGTVETVEYLVNMIRLDVHHKDNDGRTPAMHCCMSNINPVKKLQLLASKSLHAVDNDNTHLLHLSCLDGTIETVEYLVNEIGLDVYQKVNNGLTPAILCAISSISPVSKLKTLSSKGVNLHVVDNDNRSLLHVSCRDGTIETVEYLVNVIRLDINQRSKDIDTPLLSCFQSKVQQMEKINFLISKGAKIIICRPYQDSMTDEDDYSKCNYPLHHSSYLGTLDTVKLLVNDAGYDVNYTDDDNMTALLWCFKTKIQQKEKIMFLISKDAKITLCRLCNDLV
ncbi:hypothetical protein SNE40_023454 [Patella caerulea]|uniref:CARD domain-containing protein n=1 Tax=Patella caerulea TaxID=87958 RepID=A0AAN8FYI0_PATCE